MARRTPEQAQHTRDCIVESSMRHCVGKGYDSLSLDAVAKECGLTRGAIYHHFVNKKTLFEVIVKSLLEEMGNTILLAAERSVDPWNSLLEGCLAFLEASQTEAYQSIILVQAPAVLGVQEWDRLDTEYTTSHLVAVLEELQEAGVLALPDIRAGAVILSGAMNQLSRWMANGGNKQAGYRTLQGILEAIRIN